MTPPTTGPTNLNPMPFRPAQPTMGVHSVERQMAVLRQHEKDIYSIQSSLSSQPCTDDLESLSTRIDALKHQLAHFTPYGSEVTSLRSQLQVNLQTCSQSLALRLAPEPQRHSGPHTFNCSHHYRLGVDNFSPTAQLIMLLLVIARFVLSLSRRDVNFIFGVLLILISFVARHDRSSLLEAAHRQLPTTFQTVLSKFGLDGKCVLYCVCDECHCTYPPDHDGQYPSHCSNPHTPESTCNARLLNEESKPTKTFNHHLFADYIAGLLSRSDFEEYVDDTCAEFVKSNSARPQSTSASMHSPFDAEFLHQFRTPDGELFLSVVEGEARIAFSLSLDFFAPEGTSRRGKHTSIGLISLACLNLPAHLRYRPENMWADIIPGPEEPSLTDINNYLRPLVDKLLVAWTHGLKLSQTARHPAGRTARCAIILAAFDLPAGRKTAAFASHNARIFCHRCNVWDKTAPGNKKVPLDDLYRRTDHEKWLCRECTQLRTWSASWRAAPTSKLREKIFERYGVRWSELWRLPYWDPVRMMIVDPMHAGLEGIAKLHFLRALGVSDKDTAATGPAQPAFSHDFTIPEVLDIVVSAVLDDVDLSEPEETLPNRPTRHKFGKPYNTTDVEHIIRIHASLTAPFSDEDLDEDLDKSIMNSERLARSLKPRLLDALKFVANDLNIQVSAVNSSSHRSTLKKDDYIGALINWVCTCLSSITSLTGSVAAGTSPHASRSPYPQGH